MLVLGIDEVGRGSIAGPLVVGAVALDTKLRGLKDSKLLSRAERMRLNKLIYAEAKYCGLGWVSAAELDKIGLSKALTLASSRALSGFIAKPDRVLLDGNFNYLKVIDCQTIVGGDNLEPAISAASIIAKVARDNHMNELDEYFPGFGFSSHVGYCTAAHLKALSKLGPTPHHRYSFDPLKTLLLQNSLLEGQDPVFSTQLAK